MLKQSDIDLKEHNTGTSTIKIYIHFLSVLIGRNFFKPNV